MKQLTDARLELLRRRLARADRNGRPTAEVSLGDGGLAVAERRMWKIYELDPETISHNIGLVLTFDGTYEVESVVESFELMVRNAAVLSSRVVSGAVPRREAVDLAGRWIEPGAVWNWNCDIEPTADVDVLAATMTRAPFDLTAEPPLRAGIQRTDDGGVVLVLVVHHLAVDDSSWPILLGTLVSGTWQGDLARADHGSVTADVDAALRHALATWAAADVRYPLSGKLPSDEPAQSWLAPLVDSRADRIDRPIEPASLAALQTVTRAVGATSNAVLIAVSALSVHAVTGAADLVVLVPADNRRPGESPSVVGYSGNIVPMRFSFDSAVTVREALRTAVRVVYGSMEFSTVDYGAVLTALRTSGGRFPVAEIMASVRNAPLRGIPIPEGARVTCESVFTGIGNYPLTMAFELGADDGVHLEIDYQPDVVDKTLAGLAADVTAALLAEIPQALDRELGELVSSVGRREWSNR